jgi:hypothetical protein
MVWLIVRLGRSQGTDRPIELIQTANNEFGSTPKAR